MPRKEYKSITITNDFHDWLLAQPDYEGLGIGKYLEKRIKASTANKSFNELINQIKFLEDEELTEVAIACIRELSKR